jgi:CheY-like chemotaxis protein
MNYHHCHPFIVEDDSDYRLLLRRAFEKVGVPKTNVRMAPDGEEALKVLGGSGVMDVGGPVAWPSLILLDVNLPGKSGLEILSWVRKSSSLREVPVFLLTSSEEPDHLRQAFDLRVDSYFLKPAEFFQLRTIVEGILGYCITRTPRPIPGSLTDPRRVDANQGR